MDNKTFDALTRGFGAQRSRRHAVKAFVAGIAGLGIGKTASAQVSTEAATCGQECRNDGECNAGLQCSRPGGITVGLCTRRFDSNDTCEENVDCEDNWEVCRDGNCENQSTCERCNTDDNCVGDEVCRNGRCSDAECNSDRDCPRRRVCRSGRCVRDDECNSNSDCPGRRVCRRGNCVRRR